MKLMKIHEGSETFYSRTIKYLTNVHSIEANY